MAVGTAVGLLGAADSIAARAARTQQYARASALQWRYSFEFPWLSPLVFTKSTCTTDVSTISYLAPVTCPTFIYKIKVNPVSNILYFAPARVSQLKWRVRFTFSASRSLFLCSQLLLALLALLALLLLLLGRRGHRRQRLHLRREGLAPNARSGRGRLGRLRRRLGALAGQATDGARLARCAADEGLQLLARLDVGVERLAQVTLRLDTRGRKLGIWSCSPLKCTPDSGRPRLCPRMSRFLVSPTYRRTHLPLSLPPYPPTFLLSYLSTGYAARLGHGIGARERERLALDAALAPLRHPLERHGAAVLDQVVAAPGRPHAQGTSLELTGPGDRLQGLGSRGPEGSPGQAGKQAGRLTELQVAAGAAASRWPLCPCRRASTRRWVGRCRRCPRASSGTPLRSARAT